MHPSLKRALVALKRGSVTLGPVVRSARGGCMRATSIVNWFAALFASLELEGCSSHSGRRSFITAAARNAHKTGCSLRDVQLLAGHKSIQVTQGYIDGDTRAAAPGRVALAVTRAAIKAPPGPSKART
jgi:integrase